MSGTRHPGELAVVAVRGLAPYVPGKPAAELERELGISGVAKLASNENPYGPSPRALEAMQAALARVWLYPDGASHELKQELARHLGVPDTRLTVGNGSNDLLVLLAEAFLTPQHNAVFSQYGFAIYRIVTQATGARCIEVPALDKGSGMPLGHDLTAMSDSIGADTRLVFIANPNNPTGTWAQPAAVKRLLERAPPTTLIVLDEAYVEYGREHGSQDGVPWLAEHPNLVIVRTFSKAYGLAGARVGYAISHPEVAEVLNRLRPAFNVNSIAQAGAVAALQDQAYMRRVVAMTLQELARVEAALKGMQLWCAPSACNFLLVHFGARAERVYERLLRVGLIVRPVAGYDLPEYLRVSIGLPQENDRLLRELAALPA
ncbi:MAG TPA: histidinol-phosphate transaminase [Steroidobacteraceae bacterium]|jgi:histidinol-phosphate aminotransferase